MAFDLRLYESDTGARPVAREIKALLEPERLLLQLKTQVLKESWPGLGEPHVVRLKKRNGLYELRMKENRQPIRLLFFPAERRQLLVAVLCHRGSLTQAEAHVLETAERRMNDWRSRNR